MNHPITPPPELVKQWWKDAQQANYSDGLPCWLNYIATQATSWGADQELEACCEWLIEHGYDIASPKLRTSRRKPPTLKERALELVSRIEKAESPWAMSELDTIRRALEALPE
jgi:hypothetical protein